MTAEDKTKYTISFGSDGRVSVRIDCNRGVGPWKSSGQNQLRLGPLALTRAMCPPQYFNDHLSSDLDLARSYSIQNEHLFLSLEGGGVYEFERMGSVAQDRGQSSVISNGPITYTCTSSGSRKGSLRATFYETVPPFVLVEWSKTARVAFPVPAASGAKYEGKDLTFWEEHREAMVTWSGQALQCERH